MNVSIPSSNSLFIGEAKKTLTILHTYADVGIVRHYCGAGLIVIWVYSFIIMQRESLMREMRERERERLNCRHHVFGYMFLFFFFSFSY